MVFQPFHLKVSLPTLRKSDPAFILRTLTQRLNELRTKCRAAFITALENQASSGAIKRFSEVTSRQVWTHSSNFPEGPSGFGASLALIDLTRDRDFEVAFIGFEIGLRNSGPTAPPLDLGGHREHPPFVTVNAPWRLELYRASVRKLKTQQNFVFKVSVRLRFPLLSRSYLRKPHECSHEFRLLDFGDWQWRLLWECRDCGFVCHCKCFQDAIRRDPFPNHMSGVWPSYVSVHHTRIPFIENACELCRGIPSSHRFCNPNYAVSVFDARYGAYVRKRMVERSEACEGAADQMDVESELRRELGYPPFGKPGFMEVELFRIVQTIFPKDQVIHRTRPNWLKGLELDIYVPSRRLAIEYQGEQHFLPNQHWGGEEAFLRTQERDRRKQELLDEKGIVLCMFSKADAIELAAVRERIEATLNPNTQRRHR